ncbi:MAG: hypothetical protein AAGU16_12855 [Desulfitobacterium hafniense]
MYAHFALHRFQLLPGQLMALPPKERAFVYASIDLQVKKEKADRERAARKRR